MLQVFSQGFAEQGRRHSHGFLVWPVPREQSCQAVETARPSHLYTPMSSSFVLFLPVESLRLLPSVASLAPLQIPVMQWLYEMPIQTLDCS